MTRNIILEGGKKLVCECCGDAICFSCHGHGLDVSGKLSLIVCSPCQRTCDAPASVFKHPPPAFVTNHRIEDSADRGTKRRASGEVVSENVRIFRGAAAAAAAAAAAESGEVATKRPRVVRRIVSGGAGAGAAVAPTTTAVARRGNKGKMHFMPPLARQGAPLKSMLTNLVFTADVGIPVNLHYIQRTLTGYAAEVNTRRFSAVVWRLVLNPSIASDQDLEFRGNMGLQPRPPTELRRRCGDPPLLRAPANDDPRLREVRPVSLRRERTAKVAVLIFRTGKLVCTGARSVAQARYILKHFAQVLRNIGYPGANIIRMNITNMVGCAQLSCRINRERLARDMSEYASYDPEQFAGVTIKGHPLMGGITLLIFDSGCVVITGAKSQPSIDAALKRIHPLLLHFDVNTPDDTPMPHVACTSPTDDDAAWPDTVASDAGYQAFGVAPTVSMNDLRRRRRALLRKVHPDKYGHIAPDSADDLILRAERQFLEALYDVLSDYDAREAYNRTGRGCPVPPTTTNASHATRLKEIKRARKTAASSAAAAAAATAAAAAAPSDSALDFDLIDSDDDGDPDAEVLRALDATLADLEGVDEEEDI